MSRIWWITSAGVLLLIIVGAAVFSQDAVSGAGKEAVPNGAEQPAIDPAVPPAVDPAGWPDVADDTELQEVTLGEYWIGVQCYALQDAAHAELGLPKDRGLVIAAIVPDGPAHKAGIRPHDVLMKVGNKPLAEIQDLVDAVEEAGGKQLSIELLRKGEKKNVKLTAVKRPKEMRQPKAVFPQDPNWAKLSEWFEQLRPGVDHGPMRFRFIQPGTIIPPGASARHPLPENMTVIITKSGAEPARIVVKQGNQSWEVTEKELDKLPEKVRPYVERMLGRMPGAWIGKTAAPADLQQFDIAPDWAPRLEGLPVLGPDRLKEHIEDQKKRMEKHFEDVHRKLDRLLKSMEQTGERDPGLAAPEKEPHTK